jgi:hypothetical protein
MRTVIYPVCFGTVLLSHREDLRKSTRFPFPWESDRRLKKYSFDFVCYG